MGMRIGGSNQTGGTQAIGAGQWQQRQQGLKDLMSALQSGDLGAAQKAFGSLPGAARITAGDSDGPLAQIGKALQSGDLAGAQQAAQSWQAQRSGGHHHHHTAPPASGSPGTSTTASSGATGTLVNLTA